MSLAYVGRVVQTPAVALANGGEDKMPAVITAVLGEQDAGPNGGTMVALKTLPNVALTLIAYVAECEFVEYEGTARTLGVGEGCWPTDSNE
jgi:hypothetical protein